jgi:hypothetical protein
LADTLLLLLLLLFVAVKLAAAIGTLGGSL